MDIGLVITIVSVIPLLIGIKFWQKGDYLTENGEKTEAIIFKNNFKWSSDGGMYYPVVRFTTNENEWITQELSIGYRPAKPEGIKLEVIYDPTEPTNVAINSVFQLKALPIIFITIGVVGFVCGLLEYLEFIDISSFSE